MLSEDEFESALLKLKWHGCVDSEEANVLRAHDREQRAEIERLKDVVQKTRSMLNRLEHSLQRTRHERDRQLEIREAEQRKWGATRMSLILQAKKRTGARAILLRAEAAEAKLSEIVAICQENSDAEVTDPVEGVNDLVRACNTLAHLHLDLDAELSRLRDSQRVRDARVEAPPDRLILAWSDGFWVPTLGSYSPCGQTFIWWLPMPPAPEVAK